MSAVSIDDPFNCFREIDGDAWAATDGIAVGVKDSMDVIGMRSLHGSPLFADDPAADSDATVVARLRAAGARIVGKTHMTELACGTTGLNAHFGDVQNPLAPERHAGGSSAGSAAAVAAGLVPLALGSDTGGSIRVPAAVCGVVGLKPTFGRVPNDGMSVCSRHLDHIGPIAASVDLARWCLDVISDEGWSRITKPPSELTVGVLQGDFIGACEPDVVAAFETAAAELEALGATVVDLDLGIDLEAMVEHATVLSRDLFDAYGERISSAPEGTVGTELRTWADIYRTTDDATYEAALDEQRRLRSVVADKMRTVDVLLCPTMRTGVCLRSEAEAQPRDLRTGNLELFDMTGQPSLTIPWGLDRNGMPLGLLLSGRMGEDHLLLDLADAVLP